MAIAQSKRLTRPLSDRRIATSNYLAFAEVVSIVRVFIIHSDKGNAKRFEAFDLTRKTHFWFLRENPISMQSYLLMSAIALFAFHQNHA